MSSTVVNKPRGLIELELKFESSFRSPSQAYPVLKPDINEPNQVKLEVGLIFSLIFIIIQYMNNIYNLPVVTAGPNPR